MLNFAKSYVKDQNAAIGIERYLTIHTHVEGAVGQVHEFFDDNMNRSFVVNFEGGATIAVESCGEGVFKIVTDDKIAKRDLSTHPSYGGKNKDVLFRVWSGSVLGRTLTWSEVQFIAGLMLVLEEK